MLKDFPLFINTTRERQCNGTVNTWEAKCQRKKNQDLSMATSKLEKQSESTIFEL
jgi:hypothetical protein